MTPQLNWEASRCECAGCGATVIHELRKGDESRCLADGDLCPCCDHRSMRVVHNPSVVADIVWATPRADEPQRLVRHK